MAQVLIMPRQGNTVESCIIVEWKIAEGTEVSADTPVCEVETDKATFEIPAGSAGMVLKILHPAGDDVPVLAPIAVIGKAGEAWEEALGSVSVASTPAQSATDVPAAGAPIVKHQTAAAEAQTPIAPPASQPVRPEGRLLASPRARGRAAKAGVNLENIQGSGPAGRIIERDVQVAMENRPGLTAAAAATIAKEAENPRELPQTGSALGGRIGTEDLAKIKTESEKGSSVRVIKGIRKLIADRMYASLNTTAQFTLHSSASAVRLKELRSRYKSSPEELGLSKVTINDLILFAVSRVLPHYPFMNAHKVEDTLIGFERVHLGMAVDTPRGLMVPVIRNADSLSLEEISSEAKRLAAASLNGGIQPEELKGSTFTVTNLGALGVECFTPIVNIPEVAILGVCGMELKPVLREGSEGEQVVFEPRIGFSLTINHQVVDGAPAARFLSALNQAVADIDLWLAK